MIFSFVMHACIGFLGVAHFRFTLTGILLTVGVSCLTQGSDLVRLYMTKKARITGIHDKKEAYANPEKKLKKGKKARKAEGQRELEERREKNVEAKIAEMALQFKKDAPMLYARNVLIFSCVTLFTAEFCRYFDIGLGGM